MKHEEEDEEEIQEPVKKEPEKKDPPAEALPKVDLTEKSNRMIEDTNLAAKRTEDATAALKAENDRTQAMLVESKLGGTAAAGQPNMTDDEKEIEHATRFLEGTGYEDMLKPEKK